MMQLKSRLAHSPEAEKKRLETRHKMLVENTATEAQRSRLRSTSINLSDRVQYDQSEQLGTSQQVASPPTKKRRIETNKPDRLLLLANRLHIGRPNRYNHKEWLLYKNVSIKTLQPSYPNSAVSLSPN